MSLPPPELPESKRTLQTVTARRMDRTSDEMTKRWLAVLIAFVTLLVGLTSFLQSDASGRNARLTRLAQQSAIDSTSVRARGQQESAFAYYVVARGYDEVRAEAKQYNLNQQTDMAGAYLTATNQIPPLSPLLSPPYTPNLPDTSGWQGRWHYDSDTWVVTSTLLSQRREVLSVEADGWDGKSNNYVAAIAVFAVSLFLFGLAATLGGCVRTMFVALGVGLTGLTMLWVLVTAFIPIHHIPDAALNKYAQGYGLYWQGEYQQAIAALNDSLKSDPEYANAYSQRGFANLRLSPPKVTDAIKDFQTSLAKGNASYDVFWDLGWANYLAGDYPHSIEYSQKAVNINARVCGPNFNIALVRLASGDTVRAEKEYSAAIDHCQKILKDSLDAGLGAPSSLWLDMQGSADDIDNLLCQTHHLHCFESRDRPDTKNVRNPDAVLQLGEKMRKRIKESLTAMEYQHTATITPSGATMTPLRFGNRIDDERGQFASYAERPVFPNDNNYVYALWSYTGMQTHLPTVFKVFRNGTEELGLRYVYDWALETNGTSEKRISGRLTLEPGDYTVEIYGNGELLTQGSFTILDETKLPAPSLASVNPAAKVSTGSLLFGDDFTDNTHGWWTGTIDQSRSGKVGNGEYVLSLKQADDYWRVSCLDCASFSDFYYEVTARFIDGTPSWGYGLIARATTSRNAFYYFFISGDGSYSVGKAVDGTLTVIQNWTANNAIKQQATNRLGIAARGSSLEFFVNGTSIRRITDTSLTTGYVGLAVEHDNLNIGFSQLRVWQLR